MLRFLAFWARAARVPFLTGSTMPVFVCAALAWYETHQFHWGLWLLTLLGMVLIHSGANLANDFFDHLSGNDEANVEFLTPFTGGSRVIQSGEVGAATVLVAALLCFGAGSLVGLYLTWARGLWVLGLGLIGVGSSFFYTAPPFRLAHRGVGELCIALDFGLLPSLGTYYVQTQVLSWGALVAGLPSAFLITAVLFINQFQDMRADAAVGKRHWVVRLGRARARFLYLLLLAGAPVSIIVGVLLGWLPTWALIGLLGGAPLPGMLRAAMTQYDDPQRLAPANAGTVAMHLLTGVLMTLGILIGGWTAGR